MVSAPEDTGALDVPVVLVDVSVVLVAVVEVAVVEVAVKVDVLITEAIPSETMSSSAFSKLLPFLGLWDQREYANPFRASAAGLMASGPTAALRCKNTAIAVVFFQEATIAKPSSSMGAVAASVACTVQLPV